MDPPPETAMGAMSLRWPLRRLYQEPGVLPHPTLDLGRRYQHELTARHDLHEQLHPPLECADAHPERRGRLLAPQRVALYLLHRPPRGRPTPARPSRACVGRLATRKWPGRRRAARRLCGAAPYARRPAPVGWVRARPPRVTGLARSQRRRGWRDSCSTGCLSIDTCPARVWRPPGRRIGSTLQAMCPPGCVVGGCPGSVAASGAGGASGIWTGSAVMARDAFLRPALGRARACVRAAAGSGRAWADAVAPMYRARTLGWAPGALRGSSDTIRDLLACGMWVGYCALGRPAKRKLASRPDGTAAGMASDRAYPHVGAVRIGPHRCVIGESQRVIVRGV